MVMVSTVAPYVPAAWKYCDKSEKKVLDEESTMMAKLPHPQLQGKNMG
jgi:hypothetical protein